MVLMQRLLLGCQNHIQCMFNTLIQLWRQPFNSLITVMTIGITLFLPYVAWLLLHNLNMVLPPIQQEAEISLFLAKDSSQKKVTALMNTLEKRDDIYQVRYISPAQALQEFQENDGMEELLSSLDDNPLPPVMIVLPAVAGTSDSMINELVTELGSLPLVESAQYDQGWVQRLRGLMLIATRIVWLLSGILVFAVVLIVGGVIRSAIQNRREEIIVTKMVGASDAYVRLPFLYTGFFHGIGGGIIAWLLSVLLFFLLERPVSNFVILYASDFSLSGGGLLYLVLLITIGSLLGIIGARFMVWRQLRKIIPT